MKLETKYINSGPDCLLYPLDNKILFEHCAYNDRIWASQALEVIKLIEMHGEKVIIPYVKMPDAKVFIRRYDGAKYIKNPKDGSYYPAGEDNYQFSRRHFECNLIYFDYEF